MAKLETCCSINMGQSPDSTTYNTEGKGLPFFQGNADFGTIYPNVRVWCSAPTKTASAGDILISVRAPIGALNIAREKCCIGRGLAALTVNDSVCDQKYLWYVLESKVDELNAKGTGSTFKAISKKILAETEVNLPSLEEQRRIAAILDKVTNLIEKRQSQLDKLDLLVKSRFVEMFGDPEVSNPRKAMMPMTEICTIIDGDRSKNYPSQDEFSSNGYCLFLNAKNVTASGFSFENCMFITKEKDKLLKKGRLERGDVILTTRGTIGNLAFYDDSVPYENVRINSGMVILRMNHNLVSEYFFIEQFKILLSLIKEKIASGSAQPQLPISTMNKIMLLMPAMEQQKEFSNFVEKTKKFEFMIQQSLDKLKMLKKSLIQKYF